MSFYYPIPTEEQIYEKFTPVEAPCPACGASEVSEYKVLRSRGWRIVQRCRACFHYVSEEFTEQSYVPLTHGWPTSSAG
jgi:hypothetical protein